MLKSDTNSRSKLLIRALGAASLALSLGLALSACGGADTSSEQHTSESAILPAQRVTPGTVRYAPIGGGDPIIHQPIDPASVLQPPSGGCASGACVNECNLAHGTYNQGRCDCGDGPSEPECRNSLVSLGWNVN